MECLYCKKKLGFFASKKRPFCSDEHEAAFNEDQAGVALKRVLDPMFTEPLPKAPLTARPQGNPGKGKKESGPKAGQPVAPSPAASLPAPPAQPAPVAATLREAPEGPAVSRIEPPPPREPETASFRPNAAPPLNASFLQQARPIAIPVEEAEIKSEPEFEDVPGKIEFPRSRGELIEDARVAESEAPPVEEHAGAIEEQAAQEEQDSLVATPEPAPIGVEEQRALDSHRMHPMIEHEKPEWAEPEPGVDVEHPEAPFEFRAQLSKTWPSPLEMIPPRELASTGPALQEALQASEPIEEGARGSGAVKAEDAEPGLSGLVRLDGQFLSAVDEPAPRRGESFPNVETLAVGLRYPYPEVYVEILALGQPAVQPADLRRAAHLPSASDAGQAPAQELDQTEWIERRVPQLPPWRTFRLGMPAGARARFELPRQVEEQGLRDVRWKAARALREAPAKLVIPAPGRRVPEYPQWRLDNWPSQPLDRRSEAPAALQRIPPEIVERALEAIPPGWEWEPESRTPESTGAERLDWLHARPAQMVPCHEDSRMLGTVNIREVMPEVGETRVGLAKAPGLDLQAQTDRRHQYRPSSLVAAQAGYQRLRASSLIEVREPELAKVPGGLPRGLAKMTFRGVNTVGVETWAQGSAVRLRPEVEAPRWPG